MIRVLLFGGIAALVLLSPHEISSPEQCYAVVGKENITKEVWDNWEQHAYIGDKLVCAHQEININGLKEVVVYTPYPTIQVINATGGT